MPFTLSHAAAVLPVRRTGVVVSAFVAGTFGPDFEYFLRLEPRSRFGHHWPGVLLFTLPASLFALWLFHTFIKRPAAALLPGTIERRLAPCLGDFEFGGIDRFARIVLSIGAGIATHVFWDLFTHRYTWATQQWPGLLREISLPWVGVRPLYNVLQHASSIVGLAALAVWFIGWLRATAAMPRDGMEGLPVSRKLSIASAMAVLAVMAAAVRTHLAMRAPAVHPSMPRAVALLGVSTISFLSLEMLAYGIWWSKKQPKKIHA